MSDFFGPTTPQPSKHFGRNSQVSRRIFTLFCFLAPLSSYLITAQQSENFFVNSFLRTQNPELGNFQRYQSPVRSHILTPKSTIKFILSIVSDLSNEPAH